MAIKGPLEFNMLLRHDYVYVMNVVVSTLFRVLYFPHNGSIMLIHKLAFVDPSHYLTLDKVYIFQLLVFW